jgi:hypothetical protein
VDVHDGAQPATTSPGGLNRLTGVHHSRRVKRRQPVAELTLPPAGDGAPAARTELQIRYARGEGVIIDGDLAPFHDAMIRAASEGEVRAWQQRGSEPPAMLWLGELALAAGVPCLADATGFSRHTFLCGQSGSGRRTRSESSWSGF